MFFSAAKQILCNTNFLFYSILEEIFWCGVLCWCMVWRSLMIGDSESNQRDKEKEREKSNKIINTNATVTVHVHKCTILHPLMWVLFCSKCVKWAPFSILHNFSSTDTVALRLDFHLAFCLIYLLFACPYWKLGPTAFSFFSNPKILFECPTKNSFGNVTITF